METYGGSAQSVQSADRRWLAACIGLGLPHAQWLSQHTHIIQRTASLGFFHRAELNEGVVSVVADPGGNDWVARLSVGYISAEVHLLNGGVEQVNQLLVGDATGQVPDVELTVYFVGLGRRDGGGHLLNAGHELFRTVVLHVFPELLGVLDVGLRRAVEAVVAG